jgi:hypothetical protein
VFESSRRGTTRRVAGVRVVSSALAVGALVLPAAATAKTFVLRDGSQLVIAGSNVNCVIEWGDGIGHFTCFRLLDPLGNPPRGSYGFDLNSRYVVGVRYRGATIKPRVLVRHRQPASVPRDVSARKGRSRQTVTMNVGDVAEVAGSSMLALARRGQTGVDVVVGPIDNRGNAIRGDYVVALSNRRLAVLRFTNAKRDARVVFRRG